MKHNYITILLLSISFITGFGAKAQKNFHVSEIGLTKHQINEASKIFDEGFKIYDLDIPSMKSELFSRSKSNINLHLDNLGKFNLQLEENDLIKSNAKFSGVERTAKAYKGISDSGGEIRLTISEDFIYGILQTSNELLVIDQLKYILRDKKYLVIKSLYTI